MKLLTIILAFSFTSDSFSTGEYKSVPNFPAREIAQYVVSEADIKEIEKNSGDLEITTFQKPLISFSSMGYHIDNLEERKVLWQSEVKDAISDVQIDEIAGKRRLSAIIRIKDDKHFKSYYAAYLTSTPPKLYSLLRIYFPVEMDNKSISKFANAFILHIYNPKTSLETQFLKPIFPDDAFFANDVPYSSDSIRNYGNDKYTFDSLLKHIKSDSIGQIDSYFEHKARSRLSYLKPQRIQISAETQKSYDFLLIYFVYLNWDKKGIPGQKGDLTRLIVTIFGYKDQIIHTIIDSIDDKKYNLNNDAFAKSWHQNRSGDYLLQRSPQFQKWTKIGKY